MTKFKYNILPSKDRQDSIKIYLQVQLSGGFWDTIHWETEYEFNKFPEVFDKEIITQLEKGFKVRLLSERIINRSTISEILEIV